MKTLVQLADRLDLLGLYVEANLLDKLIFSFDHNPGCLQTFILKFKSPQDLMNWFNNKNYQEISLETANKLYSIRNMFTSTDVDNMSNTHPYRSLLLKLLTPRKKTSVRTAPLPSDQ